MADDNSEDQPLDPAVERVRRRMVRLMAVSIGIMMTGLMAVLGAIVYKIGQTGSEDEIMVSQGGTIAGQGNIELNDGSAIVSSSLDGNRILLHIQTTGGDNALLVYSLTEGRVIARIAVK